MHDCQADKNEKRIAESLEQAKQEQQDALEKTVTEERERGEKALQEAVSAEKAISTAAIEAAIAEQRTKTEELSDELKVQLLYMYVRLYKQSKRYMQSSSLYEVHKSIIRCMQS